MNRDSERCSLLLVAIALFSLSCNSTSPAPSTERWVYYSISSPDAATTARTGLWRYGINSRRYERVTSMSVENLTGVASNGVIVMLSTAALLTTNFNPLNTLFGRCENGSVIPVPFPVHPDPRREYAMTDISCFALAYNGHHAAYPVVDRPVGSISADTTWKAGIVLFNCYTGKIQVLSVDSFAQANYGRSNPLRRCLALLPGEVILARDASTIYCTLFLQRINMNGLGMGTQILQWRNGAFRFVDPSLHVAEYPVLLGWDQSSGAVYARTAQSAKYAAVLVPGTTTWTTTEIDPLLRAFQFAVTRSRLVVVGREGIELRHPVDGSLESTVISYTKLLSDDIRPYVPEPLDLIQASISPDGEWITCVVTLRLPWPDPSTCTRLFIFRADGSDLRFIAQDENINASISDPLTQ